MNKLTSIFTSLVVFTFLITPNELIAQDSSSVEEVVVTGSYLKSSAKGWSQRC